MKKDLQGQDQDPSEAAEDSNDLEKSRESEGRSSTQRESLAQDSPLALVQKDNEAIRRSRRLVVLMLMLAAVGTSLCVFFFTRQSERDAFETEFTAIAERMVESFLADTGRRMSQVSTLAAGVTMAMRAYGTNLYNLTIAKEDWDRLALEAISIGRSPLTAYSPYLKTDEERQIFETYVAQNAQGSDQEDIVACFLCGEGNQVKNPEANFEFPGTGVFKCGEVFQAGLAGAIEAQFCEVTKPGFEAMCGCEVLTTEGSTDEFQGWSISDGIFRMEGSDPIKQEFQKAPYAPMWQANAPLSRHQPDLYDQFSEPPRAEAIQQAIDGSTVVFSRMVHRWTDPFYEAFAGAEDRTGITVYYPIFASNTSKAVGVAIADSTIENYFTAILPTNSFMVDAVIDNSCDQAVTVRSSEEGRVLKVVGSGDLHDTSYDDDGLWRGSSFEDFEQYVESATSETHDTPQEQLSYCRYRISIYPTSELEEHHQTNKPFIYAAAAFGIFLFTTLVFGIYDFKIRQRQTKVMNSAIRSNNIVASLFPQNVRDRLYEQAQSQVASNGLKSDEKSSHLKLLNGNGVDGTQERVIADLFPHVSILFIDLQGFTAWSSEREPEQVFCLLESLYGAFDEVAHKMKIFKVETIGDCYVAACGVPVARDDHAVVMVRFADECLRRISRVTHELEKHLGPSTADLKARCGIHSGPVTAGVLRGDKARFQLFGDSMNYAARMESSGMPDRIHISPATAEELRRHGKEHWIVERPDTVLLKGKGHVQTYWAFPRSKRGHSLDTMKTGSEESSNVDSAEGSQEPSQSEKLDRLIDWNVEVLMQHLQPVVNSQACQSPTDKDELRRIEEEFLDARTGIVVDEMVDVLAMPEFHHLRVQAMAQETPIPPKVKTQLREFVALIACTYRDTPFHNFEHASHVMMSAGKLMKRIVSPDRMDLKASDPMKLAREMHENTFGISSDPLTLFTIVFGALIHDVDHTGLTNAELINKGTPVSVLYRQKSVAEQNSVDLAWEMLMQPEFTSLRDCLYTTETEFRRFRQILVNMVMATDIADKEFGQLRKQRWERAFGDSVEPQPKGSKSSPSTAMDRNRKATIVLEHIIQASDVAHTMQHWHVYIKYNKRLFAERYLAWQKGSSGPEPPKTGWYKGEMGFYDFYILPLARKLDRCGVFGVSYHEYLQYAVSNRAEWQDKGEELVASMWEESVAMYGEGALDEADAAVAS